MTKRAWTVGLSTLEKEAEMEAIYHEALVFRQRLALLINKRVDSNRSTLIARKQYDSPNWPYLQSDGIGYERAMNEILNLVGAKNVSNNEDD